ncbi:SseB family protein [Streptomyces sp. CA-210063]|uniref:SseB family protein n=1 Tax=Streptomyces sp. CA-210063 TaxID=2801029 RepID=UPI00214B5931|nr:SseB family protein [Streptomyces sp. CA-210063]UUU30914.1 SseB family protein [Streptomyces sp. CA-210063]
MRDEPLAHVPARVPLSEPLGRRATVTFLADWRMSHLPPDTRPLPSVAPYDQLSQHRRRGGDTASQTVQLQVYEQRDGTELAPVFTSHARMRQAFPQSTEHRAQSIRGCHSVRSAHGWPSDVAAPVMDAGTPEELALTAQQVRDLLDRSVA